MSSPNPTPQTFSRVAEHFATVGCADPLTLLNESSGDPFQLREQWLDAVVDVVVVFPSKNEVRTNKTNKQRFITHAHPLTNSSLPPTLTNMNPPTPSTSPSGTK